MTNPTEDELVGALDALDVPFLIGGVQDDIARALTPAALLAGLAQAQSARVRSAIIPLLLRHPEFSNDAQSATARLSGHARDTLELFYTATFLLQMKYSERLARLFGIQPPLPDLFSRALELDLAQDIETALQQLGERNAALRGLELNWVGTYEHAARTWLDYVEWRVKREASAWQVN